MDLDVFLAAACELLAVPSTADRPGELQAALEYVIDFVGAGFTVERFESGGKPSALLYAGSRPAEFRIILNAHLDVVPAPPGQFRPRRAGDRLVARGAQDMKVSALVQAQVFREQALGVGYPLALQLVTDEEVGGRNGTLHQIDRGVAGGAQAARGPVTAVSQAVGVGFGSSPGPRGAVLPAQAGMNRGHHRPDAGDERVPRAGGDEPAGSWPQFRGSRCSPRRRG